MEEMIIQPIANFIEYIKPNDASEKHFFISPTEHVYQTLLFFIIATILIIASRGRMTTVKLTKPPPPLNSIETAFKITLTINLILQMIYKTLRGWRIVSYMLQPCHAATAIYLYCLYSKDYTRATKAFQIGLHYMFFTALAIAVPDTSQLKLPFEVINFWVQHYALLLAPLYLLFFSRRFILLPSWALTSFSIAIGIYFHFFAQLPAAFLTGVNVNYMLWPPPGVPPTFTSPIYRVKLTAIFAFLAWVTGYVLPKIVVRRERAQIQKNK